ncbi:MAG TPA: pyrroloquinoline quinone biosynthesis protein PqqB [Candidatus Acidoferrum sp.]|jgi:pyrroloquinoline quinone biosynthesis protein B
MHIKILGSAAGGGFPQWNCACHNCSRLRSGTLHASSRTQTQIAFSPDSQNWFLVGASPDLRSQIIATPDLSPQNNPAARSPIAGVFLPSADVDAVAGLLHLREFHTFFIFSTAAVQKILKKENRIFRVLERSTPPVLWQTLASKGRLGCHLSESPSDAPSFVCATIPLGGEYPDYVGDELLRTLSADEPSTGFIFEQNGKSIFIAPSLSGRHPEWAKYAASADLVLIDGTFWSDDELIKTGRSQKSARAMGHLPLSGPDGLLEQFPADAAGRRILIHINNTNPILDEDSPEHRAVLDAGFEIAYDGMEFEL